MGVLKHLTSIVPGERGPILFPSGKVYEGFASGGPADAARFPQWAKMISGGGRKAHYMEVVDGIALSLCEQVEAYKNGFLLPGNYPRCRFCEKRLSKAIRKSEAHSTRAGK